MLSPPTIDPPTHYAADCMGFCENSLCAQCYDYHVTHSCVRKPVQNTRDVFDSHKAG